MMCMYSRVPFPIIYACSKRMFQITLTFSTTVIMVSYSKSFHYDPFFKTQAITWENSTSRYSVCKFSYFLKNDCVHIYTQGEKRQPYDENIRVPFIVRGPGVPQRKNSTSVALNIDMVRQAADLLPHNCLLTVVQAPTILDLAGAPIPDDMDGISLKSSVMSPTATKAGSDDDILDK